MVERLSTSLIFSLLGRDISSSQKKIFDISKTINAGKKFTSAQDDPVGLIGAIATQGRILSNDQGVRDRAQAKTQLEAAEISLRSMNDIMDRITELTVRGANDSASQEERTIIRDEFKTLVSSIVQLANTKAGNKYIFSGQQSDLQTIRLQGDDYGQAVFKHNQDNGKQRIIDGNQSSIDIKDVLIGNSQPAVLESQIVNPVPTVSGNLDFEINDGAGNKYNFSVSVSAGDDLNTIISAINTEFNNIGGVGSVAEENPNGYLRLDTSLITGSQNNKDAKIQVLASSTDELAGELYIKKQINYGKEPGLFETLQEISNSLDNNDGATIRSMIDRLSYNSASLNGLLSKVGLLSAQVDKFDSAAEDLDIKLQADLSEAQDIDLVEANVALSNAQAALQTAIRTSSNFFSQTLSRFLG